MEFRTATSSMEYSIDMLSRGGLEVAVWLVILQGGSRSHGHSRFDDGGAHICAHVENVPESTGERRQELGIMSNGRNGLSTQTNHTPTLHIHYVKLILLPSAVLIHTKLFHLFCKSFGNLFQIWPSGSALFDLIKQRPRHFQCFCFTMALLLGVVCD
jgi:hypothetical protein